MPRKLKPIGESEAEGKRHPFNMRTTHKLRRRLEAARQASGRSLAAEIEFRIEQSFLYEDLALAVREGIRQALNEPKPLEVPTFNGWLRLSG